VLIRNTVTEDNGICRTSCPQQSETARENSQDRKN
jgi:hypothetical protein